MAQIQTGSYRWESSSSVPAMKWQLRVGTNEVSAELIVDGVIRCTVYCASSSRSNSGSHIEATGSARVGSTRQDRANDAANDRSYKLILDSSSGPLICQLVADSAWNGDWPTQFMATFFSSNFRKVVLDVFVDQRILPAGSSTIPVTLRNAVADSSAIYQGAHIALEPSTIQMISGRTEQVWTSGELQELMDPSIVGDAYTDAMGFEAALFFLQGYGNDPEQSTRTFGWMFDDHGFWPRQGAAVFMSAFDQTPASMMRKAISRTTSHEIGHMFNLVHAFSSPDGSGRDQPTCMNYPSEYPGGEDDYWPAYDSASIKFAPSEVNWMCHQHFDDVAMGGNQFRDLGRDQTRINGRTDSPQPNQDGLEFRLSVTPHGRSNVFEFGEPVTILARLRTTCKKSTVTVTDALAPVHRQTIYYIKSATSGLREFRSVFHRCGDRETIKLTAKNPAIYEAVSLAYGADGYYFMEPGWYYLTAVYDPTGANLRSNTLAIWVRNPTRDEETAIVPTFTDAVGKCLNNWGTLQYDPLQLGECRQLLEGHDQDWHPLATELIRCSTLARLRGGRTQFRWSRRGQKQSLSYKLVQPELKLAELRQILSAIGWSQTETLPMKQQGTWKRTKNTKRVPTIVYSHLVSNLARYLRREPELQNRFPKLAQSLVASIRTQHQSQGKPSELKQIPLQAIRKWTNRAKVRDQNS